MTAGDAEYTGERALFYDHVATGVEGDVAFYVAEAVAAGPPVLELGCGTGRILIPVAEAGVDIVGLDASADMLAIARGKLAANLPTVQGRVRLVHGDMRTFELAQSFTLVTIPYRAFLHNLSADDQLRTLERVRQHLTDNGRLILNVFDPSVRLLAAGRWTTPKERDREFRHPRTGNRVTIVEDFRYDLEQQRVDGAFVFEELDGDGRVVATRRAPLTPGRPRAGLDRAAIAERSARARRVRRERLTCRRLGGYARRSEPARLAQATLGEGGRDASIQQRRSLMHVGMAAVFQNPQKSRTDRDVYRQELRLADLAEPLGFESIWGVEHHFTDYTMCPDVLQFLTYMAGRTQRAQLGSMVVVLPWHDPMRAAEEISMLDNIADGRLILGLGRGAGKVEFDGFRLSMDESRPRFVECAEMILTGLETGYCEYDGAFVKQPRAAIRPAPFKSFRGRTYAAAVSPESLPIMARLGVGILIIPQKPWHEVAKELDTYRTVYRQVNGVEAPPPISAGWTFCDANAERARDMARRYIGGYYQTVLDHYQFQGDHLAKTKGYEYYGKMSEKIAEYGTDTVIDYFVKLQVSGTPEQCYEQILDIHRRTGNSHYVGVFSYAGMPYDEAERNMRLFAAEVMPVLKKLPTTAPAAPEPAVSGARDVRALGF